MSFAQLQLPYGIHCWHASPSRTDRLTRRLRQCVRMRVHIPAASGIWSYDHTAHPAAATVVRIAVRMCEIMTSRLLMQSFDGMIRTFVTLPCIFQHSGSYFQQDMIYIKQLRIFLTSFQFLYDSRNKKGMLHQTTLTFRYLQQAIIVLSFIWN